MQTLSLFEQYHNPPSPLRLAAPFTNLKTKSAGGVSSASVMTTSDRFVSNSDRLWSARIIKRPRFPYRRAMGRQESISMEVVWGTDLPTACPGNDGDAPAKLESKSQLQREFSVICRRS